MEQSPPRRSERLRKKRQKLEEDQQKTALQIAHTAHVMASSSPSSNLSPPPNRRWSLRDLPTELGGSVFSFLRVSEMFTLMPMSRYFHPYVAYGLLMPRDQIIVPNSFTELQRQPGASSLELFDMRNEPLGRLLIMCPRAKSIYTRSWCMHPVTFELTKNIAFDSWRNPGYPVLRSLASLPIAKHLQKLHIMLNEPHDVGQLLAPAFESLQTLKVSVDLESAQHLEDLIRSWSTVASVRSFLTVRVERLDRVFEDDDAVSRMLNALRGWENLCEFWLRLSFYRESDDQDFVHVSDANKNAIAMRIHALPDKVEEFRIDVSGVSHDANTEDERRTLAWHIRSTVKSRFPTRILKCKHTYGPDVDGDITDYYGVQLWDEEES